MLAIFKKEFRSNFNNVIGFLFLGVLVAVFGIYFMFYNLYNGLPYINYPLSSLVIVLMILVPILTMRSFAEERRNKTDQLILTSPVSVIKIVVGKYLANAAIFMIFVAFVCLMPLLMNTFGTVPFKESYCGVLGFMLFGLSLIAIGTFASSLTENPIISAVLGFAFLFLGFYIGNITSLMSQQGNVLTKILNAYDLYTPMINFYSGSFDVTGVVYYISITVVFLFLTIMSIQKRRYELSFKNVSISAFSGITMILVLAIAVVVNIIVRTLPAEYTALDCTSEQLFSITKETKDYINSLEDDITIYVLADQDASDEMIDKTLAKYADSDHINVEYINPTINPKFAQKYTSDSLNANSLIVVSDKRSKAIDYNNLYVYEMDYSTYQYNATGYDGEGQITSAIQYVLSDNMPHIYMLTGHDENPLSGTFTEVVEKSNITYEDLNLLKVEGVPDDSQLLIINGPREDLSDDDLKKIEGYIKSGGNIMLNIDFYNWDNLKNFQKLLDNQGISTVDGVCADRNGDYYYQSQFYMLPYLNDCEFSKTNNGNYSVIMPYSVALTYDEESEKFFPIVSTSDEAIVKADYTSEDLSMAVVDGDTEGKQTLALYKTTEAGGYFSVFGSMYMFTEQYNQVVSNRNAILFSDVVNANVSENEDNNSIVIPQKSYNASYLTVSAGSIMLYALLIMAIIPLVLIITGIVIFVTRRKK